MCLCDSKGAEFITCSGSHGIPDKREAEVLSRGEGGKGGRRDLSLFLAPRVEHGVFGGPEAEQVPHLVAKLGEVLAQVVQIFHRGLVRALHLLPRGRQVAVNQAAHDLLVVLVPLLLQVLPLLDGEDGEGNSEHALAAILLVPIMNFFLTLRLFCLFTLPLEVCEQIHLLMLVTR